MTREELKGQMDELMQQYANEEIDGPTYAERIDGANYICSNRD